MAAWIGQMQSDTEEWSLGDVIVPKPEVIKLTYPSDPLINVVALLNHGVSMSTAYRTVAALGSDSVNQIIDLDVVYDIGATEQDEKTASLIRLHFKKLTLMRRLQNQQISGFMEKVEQILEDPLVLYNDCLAALVSLPGFYLENTTTSDIFSRFNEVSKARYSDGDVFEVDSPVSLVDKVAHYDSNGFYHTYYWSTLNNTLIAIKVDVKGLAFCPWNFIATQRNLAMRGDFVVSKRAGHDFALLRPLKNKYELYSL